MTATKKANLMGSIENLLNQVAAEEKSAEANTEAGGYQGSTTHPVKSVDDRTDAAQEGARSSENSADVKEDQGAAGVESQSEGFPGGQDSAQLDVGLTSKATGEDSGNEQDYKDTKDDGNHEGASSHPARTDNNALDGNKYSAFDELRSLAKQANSIGSSLLAAVAVEATGDAQKQAKALQEEKPDDTAGEQESGGDKQAAMQAAAQAGFDLAGVFAGTDFSTEDKQASDGLVASTLLEVLQIADRRAEKAAQYYQGLFKQSEGEEGDEENEEGESNPGNFPEGSSDEEVAAAVGADGGSDGASEEEQLAALLGGGEQMGAEEALGDMTPEAGGDPAAGGADPAAAMGGDPAAAMGGDPAAAMGGDPLAAAGGGDPAAAMGGEMGGAPEGLPEGGPTMGNEQALLAVLQQLGIDPMQLQQALQGKVANLIQTKVAEKLAAEDKKQSKPKTAGDARLIKAMTETVQEIISRG